MRPFRPDRLRSSLAGRVGPLRHLSTLLRFAWSTSPALTLFSLGLRIVQEDVPAWMLYVAKLFVDAVVAGRSDPASGLAVMDWLADPCLRYIGLLVGLEFILALASDLIGRAANPVDCILGERTGNATSLRLMAQPAALDLTRFEEPAVRDGLERARRHIAWHANPLGQLLVQAQDRLAAISLAAGVAVFLPWLVVLLVLALIPTFLNELRFNHKAYRRSPNQRASDYSTILSHRFAALAGRVMR